MFSVPFVLNSVATVTDPPTFTVPPSAIVSVPTGGAPPTVVSFGPGPVMPPTTRSPLLVQLEPAPVTFTAACVPMRPPTLLTVPPFSIVSVQAKQQRSVPTTRFPLLVQVEPAPVTTTCDEKVVPPMRTSTLLTFPPSAIVSAPVPPPKPRLRFPLLVH